MGGYILMKLRISFTVWVWLNFDTSLVPSARRIWIEVVGWSGSRGTDGVGVATLAPDMLLPELDADGGGEDVFTSGA